MAKGTEKKAPKKRASKYDEKVSFDGSLDDLIKTSIKHAEIKKSKKEEKK